MKIKDCDDLFPRICLQSSPDKCKMYKCSSATIFQAGRFWYERNSGRDIELILVPRAREYKGDKGALVRSSLCRGKANQIPMIPN